MNTHVDSVLVPTDGSPLSRDALDYAMAVHPAATLTLLHVINYVEEIRVAEAMVGFEELHKRATHRAVELLDEMRAAASDHEGEVRTDYVFGKPASEIAAYAADHDVDLVVMGSHGRSGLERVVLGSVTQGVLARAGVPVTVVR